MPGLVISGKEVQVPGLQIHNWNDDPALRVKLGEDGRRRRGEVQALYVHSTKGIPGGKDNRPQQILPGLGSSAVDHAARVARFWSVNSSSAAAHLIVDHDGHVDCIADLATETTYHATSVNDVTIGIEVYQGLDAEFYEGQLDAVVLLLDALTFLFTIQRQTHGPYLGQHGPVHRFNDGGRGCYGVFGHRDQTLGRGPGDPGDWLMPRLSAAGYEVFNFEKRADIATWQTRQAQLGFTAAECDGVPGPATIAKLSHNPSPGLWAARPIDAAIFDADAEAYAAVQGGPADAADDDDDVTPISTPSDPGDDETT